MFFESQQLNESVHLLYNIDTHICFLFTLVTYSYKLIWHASQ